MANASLDKNSRPTTTITVVGPKGERNLTAIIDTGFDGFLSIPSDELQKVGLPGSITVTGTAVLADNRSIPVRLCLTPVRLDREEQVGMCIIASPTGDAFVGMSFLLAFHKKLIVDVTNDFADLAVSDYQSPSSSASGY
jgi:predicted aspartyl protease